MHALRCAALRCAALRCAALRCAALRNPSKYFRENLWYLHDFLVIFQRGIL